MTITPPSVLHNEQRASDNGAIANQQAVQMKPLLSRLPIDPFIVSIVAIAALATLLPITGRGVNLANGAATAAIGLIFFLQGARL